MDEQLKEAGPAEQGFDLIAVLFTRLENSSMNLGRVQAFAQVAAQAAATALTEVQANAQLQQDYLLEQLEQCRNANLKGRDLSSAELNVRDVAELNAVEVGTGWDDVDYTPEEDCLDDCDSGPTLSDDLSALAAREDQVDEPTDFEKGDQQLNSLSDEEVNTLLRSGDRSA